MNNDLTPLKASLVNNLAGLLQTLFPDRAVARLHEDWRIGTRGALAVAKDGVFFDHESGQGGDSIDLIQYALRCDFKNALVWAKDFCGLHSEKCKVITALPKAVLSPEKELKERERMDKALSLWKKAILPQASIAERYLQNRGVTLPLPASIRFLPRAWNYTTGSFHPALIAAGQNAAGKIAFVQVIFLTEAGVKIAGEKALAKLCYGIAKGGAVRLAPLQGSIILCEGLEDGLSVLQSCPKASVWACLGTSNLINVQLPDSVVEVVIASDNDAAGRKAAQKLAARLTLADKRAKIAIPVSAKDFNEILQKGGLVYA